MKITYIFRKRRKENYSIEGLFTSIVNKLRETEHSTSSVELPFYSNGFLKRLLNIVYVLFLRSDVYHVTGDVHYITFLLPKKRTILTIHDCAPLAFERGFKASLFRLLWLKLPCSRSGIITTVSQKTKDDLVQLCGIDSDKIYVVNNFVDENFEIATNKVLSDNSILTIGTKSNKNLPSIIKVASRLKLKMSIVGPLPEDLKSALRDYDVVYKNYCGLSNSELISLYQSSGALMFPSTFEGFGLPIIEAQMLNVPVITSNIEPMRSVAGGGAVLVDPFLEESIYQGTKKLFENDSYRHGLVKLGGVNCKKYTLASTVFEYMRLYQLLLTKV